MGGRPVSTADELERLRAGLAERGIPVSEDAGAAVDAALAAIDGKRQRKNLISSMVITRAEPEVRIVPVPYDPRTGRMLA